MIDLYKDILLGVEDLTTCSYTSEACSELLAIFGRIQAAVTYHPLYLSLYLTEFCLSLLWREKASLPVRRCLTLLAASETTFILSTPYYNWAPQTLNLIGLMMGTHVEIYLFGHNK